MDNQNSQKDERSFYLAVTLLVVCTVLLIVMLIVLILFYFCRCSIYDNWFPPAITNRPDPPRAQPTVDEAMDEPEPELDQEPSAPKEENVNEANPQDGTLRNREEVEHDDGQMECSFNGFKEFDDSGFKNDAGLHPRRTSSYDMSSSNQSLSEASDFNIAEPCSSLSKQPNNFSSSSMPDLNMNYSTSAVVPGTDVLRRPLPPPPHPQAGPSRLLFYRRFNVGVEDIQEETPSEVENDLYGSLTSSQPALSVNYGPPTYIYGSGNLQIPATEYFPRVSENPSIWGQPDSTPDLGQYAISTKGRQVQENTAYASPTQENNAVGYYNPFLNLNLTQRAARNMYGGTNEGEPEGYELLCEIMKNMAIYTDWMYENPPQFPAESPGPIRHPMRAERFQNNNQSGGPQNATTSQVSLVPIASTSNSNACPYYLADHSSLHQRAPAVPEYVETEDIPDEGANAAGRQGPPRARPDDKWYFKTDKDGYPFV